MSKSVYLAGPIGGLNYAGATTWRDQVTTELKSVGIESLDPMRFKEFLDKETCISAEADAHGEHPLAKSKGILTRDFFDCQTADVILANLLPCKETGIVTIGTVLEMAWAHAFQKPLVVIGAADDIHVKHPMIHQIIGYRLDTLDAGIRVVKAILCGQERTVEAPKPLRGYHRML